MGAEAPGSRGPMTASAVIAVTALVALALIALPLLEKDGTTAPMLLFVVPTALCAVRFGLRGGGISAALGVVLASFWYLAHQHFTAGLRDLATDAAVFLLIGGSVGWAIDRMKALERELADHHELSLDLICTASFDGYFTRLNPAWERLLGYDLEELKRRPFTDFVHPDDLEPTAEEMRRQTVAGQSVINFHNRYRTADGSYRWLEWTSRPDEKSRQLFAVARDITERKEAEAAIVTYRERLEQAVYDRTRELEDARREILRRLALAAEYRDEDTFEHTERVGNTSALIATQLELPAEQIELIRLAAPLHDVGKLHVPDAILLKPGKLTAAEFERVKEHTSAGAVILGSSSSDVLQLAEEIALSHHEWWNGNGYPHQLAGEQIPLAARIVGLADVFDALTHERPYKRAWTTEDALAEIDRLSGSQFDPRVVEAFQRLTHNQLLARPHTRALSSVA